MKRVIISPESRPTKLGENAKNFHHWALVVKALRDRDINVTQVGLTGEKDIGANRRLNGLSLFELMGQIRECDTWASVDNFFHHMSAYLGKKGVVVFGKSDPQIFGHDKNVNLLKDRSCLRKSQFDVWDNEPFDPSVFPTAEDVAKAIISLV
jgi:ADP-heptose:LPS heptosyltransferase